MCELIEDVLPSDRPCIPKKCLEARDSSQGPDSRGEPGGGRTTGMMWNKVRDIRHEKVSMIGSYKELFRHKWRQGITANYKRAVKPNNPRLSYSESCSAGPTETHRYIHLDV